MSRSCPLPVIPWVMFVACVTAFTELSYNSSIAAFSIRDAVQNDLRMLREVCSLWGQVTGIGTISRKLNGRKPPAADKLPYWRRRQERTPNNPVTARTSVKAGQRVSNGRGA